MAPLAGCLGRSAGWSGEVRLSLGLQYRVALQSPQIGDVPGIHGRQCLAISKASIQAHLYLRHVQVQAFRHALDKMRNPGIGILGRSDIAFAQQAAQHVAGLGDGGDQRRGDAGTGVAVEGGAALVTKDLDRQAVDIQGQVLGALTAVKRAQPPDSQAQQALVERIDVVIHPQTAEQARQDRLGRTCLTQGCQAAGITACQVPERILLEGAGIAQVIPAHGALEHDGTYLAGQRVADPQRITRIDEVVFHGLDDTAAIEGFTEQQSAGITGGRVATELDVDGAIAGRRPGRWSFTVGVSPMAVGPLESGSWSNFLIYQEDTIRQCSFTGLPGEYPGFMMVRVFT